jgi:hypothetical protein
MSSVLFFDPNGRHQQLPPIDSDIKFIHRVDRLEQSLSDNDSLQQAVCICCDDKSTIIEGIQDNPQVRSIHLCKNHGESEENPLFSSKVYDNIIFAPNSGWEFKIRSTVLDVCIKHKYDAQFFDEIKKLKRIEENNLSTIQLPVQAVQHQQGTSDTYSEGEETT